MRKNNSSDSVTELNETNRKKEPEGQLVIHGAAPAATAVPPSTTRSAFVAPTQTHDDSDTAFGDKWVSSIGSAKYTPYPTDEEQLPFDEVEKKEYEGWLIATQLSDRKQFPNHHDWQERLKKLGRLHFSPVVTIDDLPSDLLSEQFKVAVLREQMSSATTDPKLNSFLGRAEPPENFSQIPIYIPEIFSAEKVEAGITTADVWRKVYAEKGGAFDELLLMKEKSDADGRIKASSLTLGSHRIPPNKFIVVCDHNGQPDGTKIQIWTGLKQSFTVASKEFNQNLNQMQGTSEYSLDVNYLALPNCTIARINPNEIGFCFNRTTQRIEKMLPGRYVLQKGCHFIGKAILQYDKIVPTQVINFDNAEKDEFRDKLASNLSVLCVQPNHVAFIRGKEGVFALMHRAEPYLIDQRAGFTFISCTSLNKKYCTTNEASPGYAIVTLQAGEYIIFRDRTIPIVWTYDAEHPEFNTVHLSAAYFAFNGDIYNNTTPAATVDQVTVFSKRADQLVVMRDDARNVRFLENAGNQPIVLRAPWRYVETVEKSKTDYRFGQDGGMVCRIQPSEAEWIAVVTQEGKFELIPPPLDGSAFYFYEPAYKVVGIVNIHQVGEQHFDVPHVGKVSVVNLSTGQIGCGMIYNVNYLLNPAPRPHVFVPPSRYFSSVSVTEPHITAGDVHRIYLKPDERCVVEKNGKAILLPDDVKDFDGNEMQTENGVYTFRAERLKIDGPKNKSDKEYKLGPYHFFTVDVGEVAYGSKNGAVCIWGQGEHSVNVNRNERFTGFFSINVDPVQIKKFPITSKHGITSHVDIYVGYSIKNPDLAIRRFKSHEELHQFIEETTRSVVLQLCATQPPIGYTDGDFTTAQSTKAARPVDHESDAVQEIENHFTTHASGLLKDFGVEIGTMHITQWVIDPEFVEKARALALNLQENRAAFERSQIMLQQQKVENETKALQTEQQKQAAVVAAQTEAEITAAKAIALTKTETAKTVAEAQRNTQIAEAKAQADLTTKRLTLEAKNAEAVSQTTIAAEGIKKAQAEKGIAEVVRQTEMDRVRADAEQKNALAVLAAEQRKNTAVLDAETKAFTETAEKRAQAKAGEEVAQAELNAAKLQAERIKIMADAEAIAAKLKGEANAAVTEAETKAKYPGATGSELVQLRIAELQAATQKAIAEHTTLVTHSMSAADTRDALNGQFSAVQGARNALGLNGNPMTLFGVGGNPPNAVISHFVDPQKVAVNT